MTSSFIAGFELQRVLPEVTRRRIDSRSVRFPREDRALAFPNLEMSWRPEPWKRSARSRQRPERVATSTLYDIGEYPTVAILVGLAGLNA